MSYSLNEAEALAKKAARGVGYSWGMAEEAGRATRWLCQHRIDGCTVLARCLQRMDGMPQSRCPPQLHDSYWDSRGEILCPLGTGAAIADGAAQLQASVLQLRQVAEPGLLIFFAALCSQRRGAPLAFSWQGMRVINDARHLYIELSDQTTRLMGVHDVILELEFAGSLKSQQRCTTRAEPQADAWSVLKDFAARTYAPSTAESRLKGAGAGLSDND